MARFTVEFDERNGEHLKDGRLNAAAFHRNHKPIADIIVPMLRPLSGEVLEIGSGTGQHVVEFARMLPNLNWHPSDINPNHLRSIEAWKDHSQLSNLYSPINLDARQTDWNMSEPGPLSIHNLMTIIAINVLHVAPWDVASGIFNGAAEYLANDGYLIFYGPFKRDGVHTAESNASFDAEIRQKHPEWGVRDIADLETLAKKNELILERVTDMPANNFLLIFKKQI